MSGVPASNINMDELDLISKVDFTIFLDTFNMNKYEKPTLPQIKFEVKEEGW